VLQLIQRAQTSAHYQDICERQEQQGHGNWCDAVQRQSTALLIVSTACDI